jgi:putative acetyltransferase
MNTLIRNEKENEYREIEELTREAFWNKDVPGCDEHFILHNLRKCPEFIPELDFVAVVNGEPVGNIVYSKSIVTNSEGVRNEVITFGPISVLPSHQKKGVGSSLIMHSIKTAKDMGYSAILIYGDPRYYSRFGFRCAEKYDICSFDGKYAAALLALPLQPNAFDMISGRFNECAAFHTDEARFNEFEKTFPIKEKSITETQQEFRLLASLTY